MLRRLLVLPVLALLLVVLGASVASAHATVVATSPGDGEVAGTAPRQVSMTFDEPVELQFGALRVFAPGGGRIDAGSPRHPGGRSDTVAVDLRTGLGQGTYTVAWRVISADSHPVQGAFTFSVGRASSTVVNQNTLNAGGSRAVGAAYAVIRALAYGAFAAEVGTAAFLFACWPEGAASRMPRRILSLAWILLLGTTLGALALQGPYSADYGFDRLLDLPVLRTTLSTRLGEALAARVVLLGAAAGLLAWMLTRLPDASPRARIRAGAGGAVVAVGLAATWAVSDHAGTGIQVGLAVPVDMAHLVAMAVWLGGVAVLAAVVFGRGGPEAPGDKVRMLRRFSPIAMSCVTALAVTGSYQAWRQVGTLSALTGTTYGRLLLLKLLGVGLLIGLGYLARSWISTHFDGHDPRRATPEDAGQLRRSLALEAGVAAGVLALTTALVNAQPARSAHAQPAIGSAAFDTGGPNGTGTVEMTVEPARIGSNVVRLSLLGPTGATKDVPEVQAAMSLPSHTLGPLRVTLRGTGPGHYAGDLPIPVAGAWQLAVTVRTDDIDETTVRIPVTVR